MANAPGAAERSQRRNQLAAQMAAAFPERATVVEEAIPDSGLSERELSRRLDELRGEMGVAPDDPMADYRQVLDEEARILNEENQARNREAQAMKKAAGLGRPTARPRQPGSPAGLLQGLDEGNDPLTTGVPEEDGMTVPGLKGKQSIGTELLTSELPENEPGDQEFEPVSGPGTEGAEAEGDEDGLVGSATQDDIDAMDELEDVISAFDGQTLSHGDEDGHPIQPTSPGSEDEIMPGGEMYLGAEVQEEAVDVDQLIDQLIENRARTRRRRQKSGGTLNIGQTGNPYWDEDDGPDSTNPPLDAEAPEDYLAAATEITYPTEYPELLPTGGPIPNEEIGKPGIPVGESRVVPVGEAVRVRRAIDLIVEGKNPKLVARRLLGG